MKTHLVALGVHERIDNQPYDSDGRKIPLFITAMLAGTVQVSESGVPVTDRDRLAAISREAVDRQLENYAKVGLLVEG